MAVRSQRGGGVFWVRVIVSLAATALLAIHLAWPRVKLDAIAIALIIVAILPWLSSLIESAEFPGGWKVTFRDLEKAARKIAPPERIDLSEIDIGEIRVVEPDPNLALVALRIEIEKRLRRIADANDIDPHQPLMRLFRELQRREVLTDPVLSGLSEVVQAANRAAHGATVEDQVSTWALDYGPHILAVLHSYLEVEQQQ